MSGPNVTPSALEGTFLHECSDRSPRGRTAHTLDRVVGSHFRHRRARYLGALLRLPRRLIGLDPPPPRRVVTQCRNGIGGAQ